MARLLQKNVCFVIKTGVKSFFTFPILFTFYDMFELLLFERKNEKKELWRNQRKFCNKIFIIIFFFAFEMDMGTLNSFLHLRPKCDSVITLNWILLYFVAGFFFKIHLQEAQQFLWWILSFLEDQQYITQDRQLHGVCVRFFPSILLSRYSGKNRATQHS